MTPLRRFCHSLALRLGVRVREIESWPMSELNDWLEFSRTSPIGDERADVLAAIIANAACMAKTKVADFIPQWGGRGRDMTEEEIRAVVRSMKKG
jgi:hypothetical protein